MSIAICTIGRFENLYIREFVEYYKNLGIAKIFINDNNYDGEEYFQDVINDYIISGFVDIIDYRNKKVCQLESYQNCYDTYKYDYDWIIFIDCDEFLYIRDFNNINDYLSQEKFSQYNMIHINVIAYGDNDLVSYDNRPLQERFIKPIYPINFAYKDFPYPVNDHVSSIIRGGLENVTWNSTPHTPTNNILCCDENGNLCPNASLKHVGNLDEKEAFFKHYTTKTIEEFLYIKSKRGYPDQEVKQLSLSEYINNFFKFNTITPEKIKYLQDIYWCK